MQGLGKSGLQYISSCCSSFITGTSNYTGGLGGFSGRALMLMIKFCEGLAPG
jgi:hypothetical protein